MVCDGSMDFRKWPEAMRYGIFVGVMASVFFVILVLFLVPVSAHNTQLLFRGTAPGPRVPSGTLSLLRTVLPA